MVYYLKAMAQGLYKDVDEAQQQREDAAKKRRQETARLATCEGKFKFSSKPAADKIAHKMKRDCRKSAFKCTTCHFWHIGEALGKIKTKKRYGHSGKQRTAREDEAPLADYRDDREITATPYW